MHRCIRLAGAAGVPVKSLLFSQFSRAAKVTTKSLEISGPAISNRGPQSGKRMHSDNRACKLPPTTSAGRSSSTAFFVSGRISSRREDLVLPRLQLFAARVSPQKAATGERRILAKAARRVKRGYFRVIRGTACSPILSRVCCLPGSTFWSDNLSSASTKVSTVKIGSSSL